MATVQQVTELIRCISLDRTRSDPLHQQLSRGIQSLVCDGALQAGDRIPNVADISRLCGVSKGTAMQAVDELSRRQLLIAKRRLGTHVAPLMMKTTEVLFCSESNAGTNRLGAFLEQIIEGLKAGYADPRQRFMATVVNDYQISAPGILAAAVARGVDGMAFYRPVPDLFSVAAEVSRRLPCVTLVRPIPNSRAVCVAFAVAAPLRAQLLRQMDAGAKSFAYLGHLSLLKSEIDGPYAPYSGIYDATIKCLSEAGLDPALMLSPALRTIPSIPDAEDQLIRQAERLPDRSVVVAQTGTLAEKAARLNKGFRIVTYTESRGTLEACRGKATVLYGGLELLGEAGARVLKAQAGRAFDREPESVLIEPRVAE